MVIRIHDPSGRTEKSAEPKPAMRSFDPNAPRVLRDIADLFIQNKPEIAELLKRLPLNDE